MVALCFSFNSWSCVFVVSSECGRRFTIVIPVEEDIVVSLVVQPPTLEEMECGIGPSLSMGK